jgi:hypothetical protein
MEGDMTQKIDLSLSPSGGNAVRTIAITGEVIEFHKRRAREIRTETYRRWVRQGLALFQAKARRQEAVDCADAAWLARG